MHRSKGLIQFKKGLYMPQILSTIEQYITEEREKDSIWMVFNTRYNEIHALHQPLKDDELMPLR